MASPRVSHKTLRQRSWMCVLGWALLQLQLTFQPCCAENARFEHDSAPGVVNVDVGHPGGPDSEKHVPCSSAESLPGALVSLDFVNLTPKCPNASSAYAPVPVDLPLLALSSLPGARLFPASRWRVYLETQRLRI